MDKFRYIHYLAAMHEQSATFKNAFQIIWNQTGKDSQQLDRIIEDNFTNSSTLARKLDNESLQSIREVLAHSTTIGMQIYAAVCDVNGISLLRKLNINVGALIDRMLQDEDFYNNVMTRYDVMPVINARKIEPFNILINDKPHITSYSYNEVAFVRSLLEIGTECGYLLSLASFERV